MQGIFIASEDFRVVVTIIQNPLSKEQLTMFIEIDGQRVEAVPLPVKELNQLIVAVLNGK